MLVLRRRLKRQAPNTACTRSPAKYAGAMVVGVGALSSGLRGLKLGPSKWQCLVPPTSTPEGAYPAREEHPRGRYADASRWAAPCITLIMPKGITKDILVSTV
jgi:hypothetical protein